MREKAQREVCRNSKGAGSCTIIVRDDRYHGVCVCVVEVGGESELGQVCFLSSSIIAAKLWVCFFRASTESRWFVVGR